MEYINGQRTAQWVEALLIVLKRRADNNRSAIMTALSKRADVFTIEDVIQAAIDLDWLKPEQADALGLKIQLLTSEAQQGDAPWGTAGNGRYLNVPFQQYSDRQMEDFLRIFADPVSAKPAWLKALSSQARDWFSERLVEHVMLCQPLKQWQVLESLLSSEEYSALLNLSIDPKLSVVELIKTIERSALEETQKKTIIEALYRWVKTTSRQSILLKTWKYGNYFNAATLWVSHLWAKKSAYKMMIPGCEDGQISRYVLSDNQQYLGLSAAWMPALKRLPKAEQGRLWFMNLEQAVLNYLMTLSDSQRHDYKDALDLMVLTQSVQTCPHFSEWHTHIRGALSLQQYQYINMKVNLKNVRLKPQWMNRRYLVGRYRFIDTFSFRALPELMWPVLSKSKHQSAYLFQLKQGYQQLAMAHWINYVPVLRKWWAAYAFFQPVSVAFDKSWLIFSVERLMVSEAKGLPMVFCQSHSFWSTLLEAHTRALARYVEHSGHVPNPANKKQWHVFLKCFYTELKRDCPTVTSVSYTRADFPKEYLPVIQKCFQLSSPTLTETLKNTLLAAGTVVLSLSVVWDMWQGLRTLWYQEHLRLGATVGKITQLSPVESILSQSIKDKS